MNANEFRVLVLEQLDDIISKIEADRYTMENIWHLQKLLREIDLG